LFLKYIVTSFAQLRKP